MCKNYIEKSLKRYLKRKVKITLGFIVAFLLSCNFVWAEGIEITQGDNGEILFNGEVFDEKIHEFTGNTFDGITYTNVNQLNGIKLNNTKNITFENKNILTYINVDNTIDSDITIKNDGIAISEKNHLFYNFENSDIKEIENNGVLNIKYNYILYNEGGKVDKVNNKGIAFCFGNPEYPDSSFVFLNSRTKSINNNGILSSVNSLSTIWSTYFSSIPGYFETPERYSETSIEEIVNTGNIINICENGNSYAIRLEVYDSKEEIDNKIINKGKIVALSNLEDSSSIIYDYNFGKIYLENTGILFSEFPENKENKENKENNNIGTVHNGKEIVNDGVISKKNGAGVSNFEDLTNYGVISADKPVFYPESAWTFPVHKNLGLYLSEDGHILKHKFTKATSPDDRNTYEILKNQDEKIIKNNEEIKVTISTGGANNPAETEITIKNESGKTIINAGSDLNGTAQSIKSSTIKDLKEDTGYILSSYNKTVIIDENTRSKDINNSIINAVKNTVTFDGENLTLGLNNTVVNGGYGENIIQGDDNKNTLNISGTSIINGNIYLAGGDDTLSFAETVQINGTLDGGVGTDSLVFNSSTTTRGLEEKNINILYDIKNFEKTTIASNVTLFEKTIDSNGNIKNLSVQLGDITIEENGNLNLRVDGTEKTDGKITGHALYENKGSITAENGGKLTLNTFGFGESEIIYFKETNLSNLKDEDIKLSSALHKGKVEENNTITISAKKDLEDIELDNYEKLNAIYHSLITENLDKFTVAEEQYGAFTKYLHDIYAGNPYAYSSELSRKTMSMMKNLADRDLKPDYKEWAIYGGLTHTDGGIENSYYGKGYYTYDIGSRDILADTKISGGYFKAEYGKEKDLTTGIIFGGNNSETEIGASKVEGDSFYFGTYAKKYLNDFRFTLGAGFEHGDYKADRTAIGYDGITETRKFSENYHDRGFNIYADTKYSKELGNGFCFEPSLTLEYSYVDQDGAKEDGVLAIETDSKNFDYMTGAINLDLGKEIKSNDFTHSLIAGVSYERMLSGYDEEYITGRIKGGTNFDILVPEKEKDIFSLNVKYELETEKGFIFDVKGSYRFEHDTDKDEWIVGTGIGYRF